MNRAPASSKTLTVHPFDIKVQRFLSLVEILNSSMGQFQSVSQIGRRFMPGALKLCGRDLKWIGDKSVELCRERLNSLISIPANLVQDGFDAFCCFSLGLASGAGRNAIEFQFRIAPYVDATD